MDNCEGTCYNFLTGKNEKNCYEKDMTVWLTFIAIYVEIIVVVVVGVIFLSLLEIIDNFCCCYPWSCCYSSSSF